MSTYWFKPKRYGYGFYPVSWQGWLCTLALVAIILLSGWSNNVFTETEVTPHQIARFVIDIILISTIATLLFEKRMKEPLRWRWGRKK